MAVSASLAWPIELGGQRGRARTPRRPSSAPPRSTPRTAGAASCSAALLQHALVLGASGRCSSPCARVAPRRAAPRRRGAPAQGGRGAGGRCRPGVAPERATRRPRRRRKARATPTRRRLLGLLGLPTSSAAVPRVEGPRAAGRSAAARVDPRRSGAAPRCRGRRGFGRRRAGQGGARRAAEVAHRQRRRPGRARRRREHRHARPRDPAADPQRQTAPAPRPPPRRSRSPRPAPRPRGPAPRDHVTQLYARYRATKEALQALTPTATLMEQAAAISARGYELGEKDLASVLLVRREGHRRRGGAAGGRARPRGGQDRAPGRRGEAPR